MSSMNRHVVKCTTTKQVGLLQAAVHVSHHSAYYQGKSAARNHPTVPAVDDVDKHDNQNWLV